MARLWCWLVSTVAAATGALSAVCVMCCKHTNPSASIQVSLLPSHELLDGFIPSPMRLTSQSLSLQAEGTQEQPNSSAGTDVQAAALPTRLAQQPQPLSGKGSRPPGERSGSGSSASQKHISSFFATARRQRSHQRQPGHEQPCQGVVGQQWQQPQLQQQFLSQQHKEQPLLLQSSQQLEQPQPPALPAPEDDCHLAAVQPPAVHAHGSEGSNGASASSQSQGTKVSRAAAKAAFQRIADRHKAPLCHCKEPSVLRVSKTKDNPGRQFYVSVDHQLTTAFSMDAFSSQAAACMVAGVRQAGRPQRRGQV